MRRRCQRNSVSGVTSHPARLGRASAAAIAPSKLRSASVSSGRLTCRRSTASWWRNTMISRSLERPARTVSRASDARNRYKSRYTRTQYRPPSREVNDHGRVSGTHTVAHDRTRPGEPVGMAQEQVPRRLGDPHAGGVVRVPCEVHGSGGDIDAQQQVEPAQRDGFDGREVAGDSALGPQELRPSDLRACGRWVDSGVVEDLPRPWTQQGGGRARQVRRGCGGIPRLDSQLRGAVRVGEASLRSMAGPAVDVVRSSARRCGAGVNATVCRG